MALVESGLDYCHAHHGVRNEDEDCCDFAGSCRTCHGDGELQDGKGDPVEECGDCEGSGREPCDLTPLLYEDGES